MRITALAACLVALAACGTGSKDAFPAPLPGAPVAVKEVPLWPGAPAGFYAWNTGYTARVRQVIRTQADWEAAWATIHAHEQPPVPIVPVDFASSTVLLAAMGQRGSGGYVIAIPAAALDGDTLRVGVLETSPSPADCVVAAVVTTPAAAVVVPRHDGPVEFVEATRVNRCQ